MLPLLFDSLHLLLDRHASNAEGAAQGRHPIFLQQAAVVLQDAMGLASQFPLQKQRATEPEYSCQDSYCEHLSVSCVCVCGGGAYCPPQFISPTSLKTCIRLAKDRGKDWVTHRGADDEPIRPFPLGKGQPLLLL